MKQTGMAMEDHGRFGTLQAGLDLMDQGVTVFDAELRLVAWNAPFLRLLDFPPELAFVGASFESFIRHNADLGEYGAGDADSQVRERVAMAASFSAHTTERVRPNGCVLRLRGEPLPGKGFITVYTDITEQRRIEALIQLQNAELESRVLRRTAELESANEENTRIAGALRRSEGRLRLINDNMPFLIGYVDKQQHYQYANKGYANWFGVEDDHVASQYLPDVIGADVYAQVKPYIEQALAGHQQTYEYQMTRHGQSVHARSTLVPEVSPENEVLGFFTFSQDITEQKQMQSALVQAQKMESIGQLTGGLAHDFNNLLTVIIGTLVTLQEHPPQAGAIGAYLEPALQSARRGAQLIKRLLTFTRLHPLEPEAVDVARMVSDIGELMRRSLPADIIVTTSLPAAPLDCMADPAQLESVLLNLAMNARDAMPAGGQLRIVASAVVLASEAAAFSVAPGAYALIEVADSGCGMDAATLARACEPFFTTKRFGQGSGLGLSMAYGLLKQSGGGILLHSEPGQGTSVRLVLPLASHEDEPGLAGQARDRAQLQGLVLLVDDEADVRRVVRQQLMDLGYPVIEAADAEQALQLVAQVPEIGIVLCDVVMKAGLDGRALAQVLAASHPGLRVLLMSGFHQGQAEADALPMLSKPFSRDSLAQALAAATQGQA